jgi:hypothetical protein
MLTDNHLALTEAGEGAWRVCDTRVPQTGAAHIVASIEAHDEDVEVLWIRGAIDAPGHFNDLHTALIAIDEIVEART